MVLCQHCSNLYTFLWIPGDMSTMEKEWKQEFHEWKTRYIVDWKNQFDNFLNNYEKRLKTCGVP